MGSLRRNNETTVDAAAVFPVPPNKDTSDGSAWFWRLFGGTIMGAITFLLVTLLNHLNANVDAIRTQQASWQKEVQAEVSSLRDRIVKMEEGRELDKERKATVDEQIKAMQQDVKDIQKSVNELCIKQSISESEKNLDRP